MKSIKGKNILVTGGTGSIGSEIVRQLCKFNPKTIRVFARGELGHYRLQQKLAPNQTNVRFIVGDIRDKNRLRLAMEGIDIVFHAAALKHVDICEDNPFETVQTNILGTQNVIDIAREFNIEKVIAISTDKAVNPNGVLGSSKLMAEKLILNSYYYQGQKRTKFACVRFGNVIGSNGSFLVTLKNKIQNGTQITITDPEMTRFFMTIPQAVELVLNVSEKSQGQEIFVLKMPAVKLGDLVECAINYYSKKFGKDRAKIKTKITGMRKGEKKHEVLLTELEVESALEDDKIYILTPTQNIWGFDYKKNYPGAKKVTTKSFNSGEAPLLSKKEITELIANVDDYITKNA